MYSRAVLLNLPKTQSLDIEFSDVRYDVDQNFLSLWTFLRKGLERKQILKGVNGHFKAGELTAIMGPSGAGKSTLLNILTGFNRFGVNGRIEYRSNEGDKRDWREYRKELCYIQQEDQLSPLFNVNEAMTLAADLKLGNSLNRKAKQMVIDDILDTLDLSKTKETRCDRLSGGQRKRLSVALELVDNPPVMFLDEPTTGLDSLASFQCVVMLQKLARGGRTIVCTIHQPSAVIYEMFDHVYLLAEGRCVYQGAAKNTVACFSRLGLECPQYHNPADYMIEVVSKEYGNFNERLAAATAAAESRWRSDCKPDKLLHQKSCNDQNKTTVLITPPSEFTRLIVLLHRCSAQLYRDWTVTHLKLLLHFLVGILLGLLYDGAGRDGSKSINNVGYILVTVTYLCYTSMMPAVLKFPSELPIIRKEQFNNWYKLHTYYYAFLITNLPLQMVFAVVYTSVSYYMSDQPLDWQRFLMFLSMAIMTTFIAESMGLVLGTVLDPVNGTFFGAIATCTMLIFTGFLVLFNHMPRVMYYVSYLSYLRYSMQGMVHALYGLNREILDCVTEMYCHYRVPSTLLADLTMDKVNFWFDLFVLVINFFILRVVAYCTLKRKMSSK